MFLPDFLLYYKYLRCHFSGYRSRYFSILFNSLECKLTVHRSEKDDGAATAYGIAKERYWTKEVRTDECHLIDVRAPMKPFIIQLIREKG